MHVGYIIIIQIIIAKTAFELNVVLRCQNCRKLLHYKPIFLNCSYQHEYIESIQLYFSDTKIISDDDDNQQNFKYVAASSANPLFYNDDY